MNEQEIKNLATELAKNIKLKTPEDLNQLSRLLKKITVEAALNAELTEHLGYDKHQSKQGQNVRNGYSKKTLLGDEGEMTVSIPRDRDGSVTIP